MHLYHSLKSRHNDTRERQITGARNLDGLSVS